MNREDILSMARKAGLNDHLWLDDKPLDGIGAMYQTTDDERVVQRFAALVAAHERDSAIEQCERLKWKSRSSEYLKGMDAAYDNVIKWLRARGEK